MPATSALDHYADRMAGLPPEKFIGSIIWFSISGNVERPDGKRSIVPIRVPYDQLAQWFDELSLDDRHLPSAIKRVDVFRRVTTDSKTEYQIDDDRRVKLGFEEIDYNPEFVLRHLMRDVIHKRDQSITSAHVATAKFFRGPRTANGQRSGAQHFTAQVLHTLEELGLDGKKTGRTFSLPANEVKIVESLLAEVRANYDDRCTNLHSDALRGVVRDYLKDLNAIGVKPNGAVYFVHTSRQNTVDALQELVHRIGQGCSFHIIPLLDTLDQRQMLTDAFQDEIEDAVRLLNADIATLNHKAKRKAGAISAGKYAEVNGRLQDIMGRAREYTDVLGLAQERSAAALEMAMDAVMDMAPRVGAGGA